VRDTRPGRPRQETEFELDTEASSVLLAIDQIRSSNVIERALHIPVTSSKIAGALDRLVEFGLAVRDGNSYLGLPILDRPTLPTPNPDGGRARGLPLLDHRDLSAEDRV
jgi:hypothetical protein